MTDYIASTGREGVGGLWHQLPEREVQLERPKYIAILDDAGELPRLPYRIVPLICALIYRLRASFAFSCTVSCANILYAVLARFVLSRFSGHERSPK